MITDNGIIRRGGHGDGGGIIREIRTTKALYRSIVQRAPSLRSLANVQTSHRHRQVEPGEVIIGPSLPPLLSPVALLRTARCLTLPRVSHAVDEWS